MLAELMLEPSTSGAFHASSWAIDRRQTRETGCSFMAPIAL